MCFVLNETSKSFFSLILYFPNVLVPKSVVPRVHSVRSLPTKGRGDVCYKYPSARHNSRIYYKRIKRGNCPLLLLAALKKRKSARGVTCHTLRLRHWVTTLWSITSWFFQKYYSKMPGLHKLRKKRKFNYGRDRSRVRKQQEKTTKFNVKVNCKSMKVKFRHDA